MSTNSDNRVLNRVGARELTHAEVTQVTGGVKTLILTGGGPNHFDTVQD